MREYEAAEAHLRQVLQMPEASHWLARSETYRFLAEAYVGQGKLAEALAVAQKALVAGQQAAQLEYIGGAWRVLGMVIAQFNFGFWILDFGLTDDPRSVSKIQSRRPPRAEGPLWVGNLKSKIPAGHDVQNPGVYFAESLQIFTEIGLEVERARTLRVWANFELQRGDREQGEAMWQEARQIFARLGLALEVERMEYG